VFELWGDLPPWASPSSAAGTLVNTALLLWCCMWFGIPVMCMHGITGDEGMWGADEMLMSLAPCGFTVKLPGSDHGGQMPGMATANPCPIATGPCNR
jgi:hypothetical protein